MSTTYQPGEPQGLSPEAAAWLRQELMAIKEGMERAKPYETLQILHAEPKRLSAEMVVHADGSDWDPGSGPGLYRRSEDNSGWVFIG